MDFKEQVIFKTSSADRQALQEKANQLKSKLIKRKNNILSRLTRRSTIVKIPDLGRLTRKLRRS